MLVGPVLAIMEEGAAGAFGDLVLWVYRGRARSHWTVYSFFRDRGWRVLIFPNGLAQVRTGKTTVVHLGQCDPFLVCRNRNYRNGVHIGTTYNFTLQGKDGQKLSFSNGLANVEQLGNTIGGRDDEATVCPVRGRVQCR